MARETERNAPCPCGSGKKYKNCCGRDANANDRDAAIKPPNGTIANVLQFAKSAQWSAAYERAVELFAEPMAQWSEHAQQAALDARPDLAYLFDLHLHEWLVSDYVDPDLGNVADSYLQRRGWRESADGKTWLRALRDEPLSLYEVQSIDAGVGMTLRDVLRAAPPVFVREVAGSRDARPWDYLVTRVVAFRGAHFLSGAALHFTREMGEAARDALRARLREQIAEPATDDWNAFLRACGPWFMAEYMRPFMEPRPMPTLVDAAGDRVVMASQRFTFAPECAASLRARLAAHADFSSDDELTFRWTEPADGGSDDVSRILGTVRIDDARGVFETTSKERHARGGELLRSMFGDDVRWLPAAFQDPWQAARDARPAAASEGEAIPPDVRRAVEHEAIKRHYKRWFDEPVPMLGDITPREAARTDQGRAKLVELLKYYENGEARKPAEDRYDFTWMWKELGLQRPAGHVPESTDGLDENEAVMFGEIDAELADDDFDDDDFDDDDFDETDDALMNEIDAMLADIVNKQIRENEPPETRKTYERLRRAGYDDDETMYMLCAVVDTTLHDVLAEDAAFDLKTYVRLLRRLPDLPDGYEMNEIRGE